MSAPDPLPASATTVSGPRPAVASITPASLNVIIWASRLIFLYLSLKFGLVTMNSFPVCEVTIPPSGAWLMSCACIVPYWVLTSSSGVSWAKLRPVPVTSSRCMRIYA